MEPWTTVLLCWPFLARVSSESDVTASTSFALNLFQQISTDTSDNTLFSPFGVSVSLSILSAAAKGETAKELESVFGSNADDVRKELQESFKALCPENPTAEPRSPIALVNLLVLKKGLKAKLLPQFLSFLSGDGPFKTFVTEVKEDLVNRSNNWVRDETKGKITKVLDDDSADKDTGILFVNAIHFKGEWREKFESRHNYNGTFRNADGTTTDSVFMFKRRHFEYALDAKLKTHVISLPYEDAKARLILLVPLTNDGVGTLANALAASEWQRLLGSLRNTSVALSMPKFSVSTHYNLVKPLEQLGLKNVFTDKADLSGMLGSNDLFVSDFEQVSKLKVDEEGSEADSATVMRISGKASEEGESVTVDHPFIFAVTVGQPDDVLLMGQVNKLLL